MIDTAFTRRTVLGAGLGVLVMSQARAAQRLAPVDRLAVTFLVDGAVSSFVEPIEGPGSSSNGVLAPGRT